MTDKTIVQPCWFFDGKCEEDIDFYQRALGAKIEVRPVAGECLMATEAHAELQTTAVTA